MAPRQRLDGFGDPPDQRLVRRVGQVQRRPDVKDAGVDVAEHPVIEPLGLEDPAELRDEGLEVFGRHRAVLHEGQGPPAPRGATQEPHRLLAHGPDGGDVAALHDPVAAPPVAQVAQLGPQRVDRAREIPGVVAGELHDVDAPGTRVGEERRHLGPDRVPPGEVEDVAVHRLHRGRAGPRQHPGVAQRGLEIVVEDGHQHREPRNGKQVQLRLGDQPQRPLGPADHRRHAAVGDMREVVARERAVHLRKAPRDLLGVLGGEAGEQVLQRMRRRAVQHLPARPHQRHPEHVVGGLAVGAAALSAGVRRDHAAEGRARGGGEFRREEQPVRAQCRVQMVLDDAGLDPGPSRLDVDLEDAGHVPRAVDDHAPAQRLPVGARAAAPGPDDHLAEPRLPQGPRDPFEIGLVPRMDDGVGRDLVDRVVGGEHRALGRRPAQFALEPRGGQRREEAVVDLHVRRRTSWRRDRGLSPRRSRRAGPTAPCRSRPSCAPGRRPRRRAGPPRWPRSACRCARRRR